MFNTQFISIKSDCTHIFNNSSRDDRPPGVVLLSQDDLDGRDRLIRGEVEGEPIAARLVGGVLVGHTATRHHSGTENNNL